MTSVDRKLLMLAAVGITFGSMLPLVAAAEFARPVLLANVTLGFLVWFIAWSAEPDDPDALSAADLDDCAA